MYSKAKLLGHPIHPMLVAFPVAFYAATLVLFLVYAADGGMLWLRMAIVANWAGVVMAVVAALPGTIDWATGIPARTEAKRTGLAHMTLNVSALVLFLLSAILYSGRWDDIAPSSTAGVILSALGMALTLPAGFLGWKLVQDHHVGVRLTAAQERLEPQPPVESHPSIGFPSGGARPM